MDAFMTGVAVALTAYLAGSVSTAYLLTRMVKRIDIRTVGSRNPGAVNVFTVYTGQGATQISLCLALSAVVVATHFALAYKEVVASVRAKGVWGLFDVE